MIVNYAQSLRAGELWLHVGDYGRSIAYAEQFLAANAAQLARTACL